MNPKPERRSLPFPLLTKRETRSSLRAKRSNPGERRALHGPGSPRRFAPRGDDSIQMHPDLRERRPRALGVEHLARIEQVLRVERGFDAPHEVDRDRPMLLFHVFPLLLPNPVFAGAGAAHGDGAMGKAGGEGVRGLDLGLVLEIDERGYVEIAVADMADDRRDEAAALNVVERLLDAIGQPRDRHAGVGGEWPRAGSQRQLRPIGVVTRLPELAAVLGLGGGSERAPAMARGDVAKALRLLGDALFGAVELDQEQRLFGQ